MEGSLNVLVIHNSYQNRGGEDSVVAAEVGLLEAHGHRVKVYRRSNDELKGRVSGSLILAGIHGLWSLDSYQEVDRLLRTEAPDIAHFHNTFPLISPSPYYACKKARVPVVQTLHNYRLLCPAATLLRDGKVCESCLRRTVAWPGVIYGCYRGSRPATGAVAAMLTAHHAMRTWTSKVDGYIALSEFARRKFIQGGLPAERIFVKPNFIADVLPPKEQPREYALFVGRLAQEKGPDVLLAAWRLLDLQIPLFIVGDGPLRERLTCEIANNSLTRVELTGQASAQGVRTWMSGAKFLIFPSNCYETFGLVIAEAFALGLPVIASRLGAAGEIVEDGVTGLHFEPGNAADLAAKVRWAWNHPHELARMGRAARAEYEARYTAQQNYIRLMAIYQRVMGKRAEGPAVSAVARDVIQVQSAEGTNGL